MSYVGKLVLHKAANGGICMGRIKAECKVNSMKGEKGAFILEGRVVGYLRDSAGNVPVPTKVQMRKALQQDGAGYFFHIQRINGDSILHTDSIDLEKDVVTVERFLGRMSSDELFVVILAGRSVDLDDKALGEFIEVLVAADKDGDFMAAMKSELERRMEHEPNTGE